MEHRVDDKVPAKDKELMAQEEARGFGMDCNQHADKWSHLRASYCTMLEQHLDEKGIRSHWGKTLKQKMKKYSVEAMQVLEEWARFHGLDFTVADVTEQDEEELSKNFDKYLAEETENLVLAGERLYDDSPYGILLRVLDDVK